MDNRALVDRYLAAHRTKDWATVGELVDPEIVVSFPQSGETFRGRDNYVGTLINYPDGLDDSDFVVVKAHEPPKPEVHVVSSPIGPPTITVSGGGDTFFVEGVVDYPNGETYHWVGVVTVRNGAISTETWYFARPFDPPEWRAEYVEP